jgi:hypothetical protein
MFLIDFYKMRRLAEYGEIAALWMIVGFVARNQLIEAAEAGSQADTHEATAQLVIALTVEGWLEAQPWAR